MYRTKFSPAIFLRAAFSLAIAAFALCLPSKPAEASEGYSYWAYSGGGSYVSFYYEASFATCITNANKQTSYADWEASQRKCVGTYNSTSGVPKNLWISACVQSAASTGYCTWNDSYIGNPTGHQDRTNVQKSTATCSGAAHFNGTSCVFGGGDEINYGCPYCNAAGKTGEGNPIHAVIGNKYQREVDYAGPGPFALRLERSYNSFIGSVAGNMARDWRSTYDRNLRIVSPTYITAIRPDGREINFSTTVDSSTNYLVPVGRIYTAPAYVTERLEKTASGFRVYGNDDVREDYSTTGKVQLLTDGAGYTQTMQYDTNNKLQSVTDTFGRALTFDYDTGGRVYHATAPGNLVFTYEYNAGRLVKVTYPDATFREYLYTVATWPHLLTGIKDENGTTFATWGYNASANYVANSSQHGTGSNMPKVTLTYVNSATTNMVDAVDATHNRTRSKAFASVSGFYKPGGASASCSGCGGPNQTVTYTNDFVDLTTDFNGVVADYDYNSRGLEEKRIEAKNNALARTIATQWHADFRVPVQVDEVPGEVATLPVPGNLPGRQTLYTYWSGTNLPYTVTVKDRASGEQRTTTRTYTQVGSAWKLDTVDGPRTDVPDVIDYDYDAAGNLIKVTTQVSATTSLITEITEYDVHGNPMSIVDPNGVVTKVSYNWRQQVTSRTVAFGTVSAATTTYAYDAAGLLDKVTQPDGAYLDYDYDSAHRVTDVRLFNASNQLSGRTHYELDGLDNRTAEMVYDASGSLVRQQSWEYDTLGRLDKVKNAAGQVVTDYGYDSQGNRTSQIDYADAATSYTTSYVPDELNRIKQITDGANGVTKYGYDNLDQLVSVIDPKDLQTTYLTNALGEVSELLSPDTGSMVYTYDQAGNRATQTDARGTEVDYSYDALGRLTLVDYAGSVEDISYAYDGASPNGKGRLTGVVDAAGSATLGYGTRGTLAQETRVIGGTSYVTGYEYDVADRVIGTTYPSNRVVTYQRNGVGEIIAVTTTAGGNSTTLAQGITYVPFGGVKSYTLGNGAVATRTYDTDYRLQTIVAAGSSPIQNLDLDYDLRGNITFRNDLVAAVTQNFSYDGLSRLSSASGAYGTQGFTYDGVGNRLTQTGGASEMYNYDSASHHLSSLGSGANFTYDDAGNVTAKGGLSLTYNEAHRVGTANLGSITVANTYGAKGQRIKKTASGVTTVYSYDQAGQLISEHPDSGSLREYIWLRDIPLAQSSSAGLAYYHVDQLNTPNLMTDASQAVVWQASYEPFGAATVTSSVGYDNPLRFPGQYFDAETGLHQNWHRDYDPSIGRYLQSDPSGLDGGLSTYAYAALNPLLFGDPLGLKPGDKFKSVEDALKDLRLFAPTLSPRFVEHGGWIFSVGKGKCVTYNVTTSKLPDKVLWDDLMAIKPTRPLATWHTHGFRGPSQQPRLGENRLSGIPGGSTYDTGVAEKTGVPIYLIAPDGSVPGYDPKTDSEIPDTGEGEPCHCSK